MDVRRWMVDETEGKIQWWALVNTVMSIRVPYDAESFIN
jgi:hypothetical protein